MDKGLDKSIIREFAKLRVLATCRFHSMDELVQDLASALEESSNVPLNIKHWKRRERRRPSMKLNVQQPSCSTAPRDALLQPSEDSASSVDGLQVSACGLEKNAQHTDSDGGSSGGKNVSVVYPQKPRRFAVGSFAESDSVNENFSPVRPHRRKRKFKRMAVDPCSSVSVDPSTSLLPIPGQKLDCRKGKLCVWLKHHHSCTENSCCGTDSTADSVLSGKRKHSMRERSVELLEGESTSVFRQPNCLLFANCKGGPSQLTNQQKIQSAFEQMEENMYSLIESSSSLSSSESDAGIYTNDEGREGDDEQSDFYHEAGPACGIPGVKPWWESDRLDVDTDGNNEPMDATFQSLLNGSFQHMSCRAQQAYKDNINAMQNVSGRKIRAGRRRLRDSRPGFSIVSSMNERISKFLQDPEQNELKLYHMRKTEMDQLSHLASLYSLNVHTEGSKKNRCPVLTKTRNTTQTTNVEKHGVNNVWNWTTSSDIKRRRRTPPASPELEPNVGEGAEPIPESNVGNQLLRNMGWEPGSGLGPTADGIKTPVTATVRPKYQGLGFAPSSTISKPT